MDDRRRLVCGVDASDGSFRAAAVALELADRLDAGTVFVHVLRPRGPQGGARIPGREAAGGVGEADRGRAHAALASIEPLVGSRRAAWTVERGDPAARLAAVAGSEGAPLVVVGCLGTTGANTRFMGSVATGLAADARRPVVVVPDTVPPRMDRYEWGAGTVVCGVDGSPPATAAAGVAVELADALETTTTLVCAEDPSTCDLRHADAHEILRATAAAVAGPAGADRVAVIGTAARQLARIARERDASVLVVGAHGQSRAAGRALGSVGSVPTILTGLAPCPVLIVPPAFAEAADTFRTAAVAKSANEASWRSSHLCASRPPRRSA